MVFYNPLCLEESGGPISLPSTGILYRKPFVISFLTFCYSVLSVEYQKSKKKKKFRIVICIVASHVFGKFILEILFFFSNLFVIFILVILLQIISICTIKFLVNLNFLGKLLLCLIDHFY